MSIRSEIGRDQYNLRVFEGISFSYFDTKICMKKVHMFYKKTIEVPSSSNTGKGRRRTIRKSLEDDVY